MITAYDHGSLGTDFTVIDFIIEQSKLGHEPKSRKNVKDKLYNNCTLLYQQLRIYENKTLYHEIKLRITNVLIR